MERRSAAAIAKGDALPEPPGAALPEWVQAQTTYCILEKTSTTTSTSSSSMPTPARCKYNVKCVKQKIVVDGVSYELKEIYGIEKTMGNRVNGNAVSGSSNEKGKSADGTAGKESEKDMSNEALIDNDDGAECVICLSEPKTTTVFPCRCAKHRSKEREKEKNLHASLFTLVKYLPPYTEFEIPF